MNNTQTNTLFQGVVQGCLYGQQDRVDELNTRMQGRQFSDSPLRPNYDPRPVSTKYSLFPVIDRKPIAHEPLRTYLDDSHFQKFSPITRNGPPKQYLENIDTETILRNQTVSLQHGAEQGVYVPSSHSDLYKINVPSTFSEQPFPGLFKTYQADPNIYPIHSQPIGKSLFSNHTRTQLRNTVNM
jgi:hypothetical protein